MSVFAKRLRQARLLAGLSQEQLGLEAGLDPMSASARMNRYERGKRMPDLGTVERIASALNVPVAYLYAGDDDVAEILLLVHRLPLSKRLRAVDLIKAL